MVRHKCDRYRNIYTFYQNCRKIPYYELEKIVNESTFPHITIKYSDEWKKALQLLGIRYYSHSQIAKYGRGLRRRMILDKKNVEIFESDVELKDSGMPTALRCKKCGETWCFDVDSKKGKMPLGYWKMS